jgi:hypothetical protein
MASTQIDKTKPKLKRNNDPRMPVTISYINKTNPSHKLRRQVSSEFFNENDALVADIERLKKEIIPNCYFHGLSFQKPRYQIEHDEKIRLAKIELESKKVKLKVIKKHKLMFSEFIYSVGKKTYNPLKNFIEDIYFDPNIMPIIFGFIN